MKKTILPVAIAALMLASCGKNVNTSKKIKNSNDSFSYSVGFMIGKSLKSQGIDAASVDYSSFFKGYEDAMKLDSGFAIKEDKMDAIQQAYVLKAQEKKVKGLQEETKKYMEANAKKQGITLLPSKSQYKLTKPGSGQTPQIWDTIEMHYIVNNIKGEELANSKRNPMAQPMRVPLSKLGLPPLEEAFQKSAEGSEFEIYIPADVVPNLPFAKNFEDKYGVFVFKVEFTKLIPGKPGSEKQLMPEMPPQ